MDLRGIAPVVPTPFDESGGSVDHPGLDNLSDLLAESAVGALVTLGVASESRALAESERSAVVETVVSSANVRKPVIAGVDGYTQAAIEQARTYRSLGAAAIMLRTPPGCAGAALVEHVRAVAAAADLPIMLQNAPQETGVDVLPGDLERLCRKVSAVFSIKEESVAVGARTTQLAAAGLRVFTGNGGVNYPEYVERGAVGCVPGLDLAPAWLQIDRLLREGPREAGLAEYEKILPLLTYGMQSLDLYMQSQKLYFKRIGLIGSAQVRGPVREFDEVSRQTANRLFARLARRGVPGFDRAVFDSRAPGGQRES
jgi:4-hydroxy-tetrahydrodipicolinate synthase